MTTVTVSEKDVYFRYTDKQVFNMSKIVRFNHGVKETGIPFVNIELEAGIVVSFEGDLVDKFFALIGEIQGAPASDPKRREGARP